jgi:mono/diheme cytochrome c family protein
MARTTRGAPTFALTLALAAGACGDGVPRAEPVERPPPTAAELAAGQAVFDRACADCHGPAATGTDVGPPLVHRVYEPRHHSDFAFRLAIRQGVRAHHWRYGDMPPVPGLDDEEVELVIAYIRQLQRDAGIF